VCYPTFASKLELHWNESPGMSITKLEEDGDNYLVNRASTSRFPITHVMRVRKRFCSCGMWQEHGYPCVNVMVYYRFIEKISLLQI
jgi:SWIM zinc finger